MRSRPRALDGVATEPGGANVVVLDQDAVVEPGAVVPAAADGDGVLLEDAQAGGGLARVEDRDVGSGGGVHVAARQGRDAGQASEVVERGPLAGEDGAQRPGDPGGARAALDQVALLDESLDLDLRVQALKTASTIASPQTTPGSLTRSPRFRAVGVDDRVRRHVALAHVLGERRVREPFERVGGYSHVSRAGSEPGRRTT